MIVQEIALEYREIYNFGIWLKFSLKRVKTLAFCKSSHIGFPLFTKATR